MTKRAPTIVRVPRRRSRNVDPSHPVYEIDVWLAGSEPVIWRSLAVPADLTLGRLHVLMQMVMEWEDYHMHLFETRLGRRFEPAAGIVASKAMWDHSEGCPASENEARITLRDLFEDLKEAICYRYDFGDCWDHGIKLVKTHRDASAFAHVPICLAGDRAAPPEDSGGVWGYEHKLEVLRSPDPNDGWHQEIIEWLGGTAYDAESFDLESRNRWISAAWQKRRSRPRRVPATP